MSTLAAASKGTFIALALVATLATLFNGLARFSAFQGSEDLAFLQFIARPDLDLAGLLLAAIIFGALGILDDVTMTQAATVHALFEADPSATRLRLAQRAMNIGRSHIAATTNTLVLAYVGASLPPLIVLLAAGYQDPFLISSRGDRRGRGCPLDCREHRDRGGRPAHDRDRGATGWPGVSRG